MDVLGIDIGGSGVKAAVIDTMTGKLISEKIRFETPTNSSPKNIFEGIKTNFLEKLDWKGKVGCGFPGVVIKNKVFSAANISNKWVGVNIKKKFSQKFNLECKAINDADAAGISEITLNNKIPLKGTVMIITVGTGFGTSIFIDGKLVPNIEFGHLKMYGDCAEKYASNLARKKLDLSWKEWSARFNEYIDYVELLISPNLIILGGGISNYYSEFKKDLRSNCKILSAKNKNNSGIIGAALSIS